MNYNFNVRRLVLMLAPSFARRVKETALVTAFLAPLERLKNEFLSFINSTRYNALLSGQVTVLQMHLNNVFDYAQRRIRIIDGEEISNFIWFKDENQAPDYIRFKNETDNYTMYLRFKDEVVITNDRVDFVVQVPVELDNLEEKIKAVVDAYKLAGKRYKIIFV